MEKQTTNIHEALIEQCRERDRKAQFEVYNLYSTAMYNICTRIMVDQDAAKDALQEAFISAFNNISSYRNDAAFGAWLKRIVINQCVKQLKAKQQLSETQFDNYGYEKVVPHEPYTPDPKIIQESIKKLPPKCRTVFTLYCLEGYDHQEISEILTVSVGTSKSQFNYAKKLLREELKRVL